MEKDLELKELFAQRQKNWGRIIFHLKKKYEDWLIDTLAEKGYPGFKMSFMQLIMYIDTEGSIGNDLALQANVTRQAMSKIVKELEEEGYISTKHHADDKRTIRILLTKKGKNLVLEIFKALEQLTNDYKEVIGAKRFDSAMQVFLDILEFHEK